MNAAIATSDPRASAAAASVLRSGGNAIDAAVTAALVLYVVEPQSCGVGGDGFLMVYNGNAHPSALDGSGAIPIKLTTENLKADGLDDVPPRGARSVTTPGAIHLLETALQRFGTITFSQALGPAIEFARKGFRVRDSLARASAGAAKALFQSHDLAITAAHSRSCCHKRFRQHRIDLPTRLENITLKYYLSSVTQWTKSLN